MPWICIEPSSDKEWVALWLQGWSSTIDGHHEGIARMANRSQVTFAMIDYEGHGDHPVELDDSMRTNQLQEVIAAYDNLKDMGYKNIITIGGSFGAYMAALLASKRDVHSVILRASANYPDEEFELPFRKTARWQSKYTLARSYSEETLKDSNAIKAIAQYAGFTYILEHELDEVVPSYMPKGYFAAAKHGNYLIVPSTKHSPKLSPNPQVHFAVIEHLIASIIETIKLGSAIPYPTQ